MNKTLLVAATCSLFYGVTDLALAGSNNGRGPGPGAKVTQSILEFQTMVGVDGPFLGAANPIRGVNGGGLPWVLDAAQGDLRDSGKLDVEVVGLVIPGTSPCGIDCNPAPFFRATVSCLTVEAGAVVTENLTTGNGAEVMIGDPMDGNARIEAQFDLPDPCVAPMVFVTSPGGAWFAATGSGVVSGN